jgi:hypothetical protein
MRRYRAGEDVFIVSFIREQCHFGIGVRFYFGWDRIGLIQRMVLAGRQFFRKKHPTSLHSRRFFLFMGFWFWILDSGFWVTG